MERWRKIKGFSKYSISSEGRVRNDRSDHILALYQNQGGVVMVGLMKNGRQMTRSLALLVAQEYVPQPSESFDTPINLNGDRLDNRAENLAWRPRWFASAYNRQFTSPLGYTLDKPIIELRTRQIAPNSFECATRYGLLEKDLIHSLWNHTAVGITGQRFAVVDEPDFGVPR